jgi:hypothetical protein
MADMSRAIRMQLQLHGPTLKDVPTEDLREYTTILQAFYLDLREELEKRDET